MGMAASQARLLTITARMHDVEYQAQSIQNAKISLANQEDQVYQDYLAALDSTTFTVKDNNNQTVVANFNSLSGINAARATSKQRYLLRDDRNRIIVSSEIAQGYEASKSKVNNAYEFALFMMEGQPENFDAEKYEKVETEIFDTKNNENKLTEKLKSIRDSLAEKILSLYELLPELSDEFDEDVKYEEKLSKVKNSINDYAQYVLSVYKAKINEDTQNDPNYTDEVKKNNNAAQKLVEDIEALMSSYEYQMYQTYSEDIYTGAGNNAADYENDDFWYYVNMYKQIESNGDSYVCISEFDGIDGIGDAASDSDWLKNQVQSGRITIDISNLDNNGNISFNSTGVPSDSALEYTTTSTIDKAALAKAEAEYEHKMKEIDNKDKKFDMDLNKLETERTALKTEYDSVKKVIEDNIERTFGIFS